MTTLRLDALACERTVTTIFAFAGKQVSSNGAPNVQRQVFIAHAGRLRG